MRCARQYSSVFDGVRRALPQGGPRAAAECASAGCSAHFGRTHPRGAEAGGVD